MSSVCLRTMLLMRRCWIADYTSVTGVAYLMERWSTPFVGQVVAARDRS